MSSKENSSAGSKRYKSRSYTKSYSRTGFAPHLNFNNINSAALGSLLPILSQWLPQGKLQGQEYIARNPMRADRSVGSFKVNLRTGKWADFATGDRGGDPISLAAYLSGTRQREAAYKLMQMLGLHND